MREWNLIGVVLLRECVVVQLSLMIQYCSDVFVPDSVLCCEYDQINTTKDDIVNCLLCILVYVRLVEHCCSRTTISVKRICLAFWLDSLTEMTLFLLNCKLLFILEEYIVDCFGIPHCFL